MENIQRVTNNVEILSDFRKKALLHLEYAAQKQHPDAQMRLGLMLDSGIGLPQDRDSGFYWLLMASQQGQITAQRVLGAEFVRRRDVAETEEDKQTNMVNAVHWLRKASESGDIESKNLLGQILLPNWETKEEAIQLLREAASGGSQRAQESLDSVDKFFEESEEID